jgi:hypothetical protein
MLHFVGKLLQGRENLKKMGWDLKVNSGLLKNSVDSSRRLGHKVSSIKFH